MLCSSAHDMGFAWCVAECGSARERETSSAAKSGTDFLIGFARGAMVLSFFVVIVVVMVLGLGFFSLVVQNRDSQNCAWLCNMDRKS